MVYVDYHFAFTKPPGPRDTLDLGVTSHRYREGEGLILVFFFSPILTAELFPHLLRRLSDPVDVVADLVPEPVIGVLHIFNVVISAVITEPCYCP